MVKLNFLINLLCHSLQNISCLWWLANLHFSIEIELTSGWEIQSTSSPLVCSRTQKANENKSGRSPLERVTRRIIRRLPPAWRRQFNLRKSGVPSRFILVVAKFRQTQLRNRHVIYLGREHQQ